MRPLQCGKRVRHLRQEHSTRCAGTMLLLLLRTTSTTKTMRMMMTMKECWREGDTWIPTT